MKNLLLKIEYLGTRYSGWQIQPNADTVEAAIKQVFEQICQCQTNVKACSRTDAGVHAMGQVATVMVPEVISLKKLFKGSNSLLPEDIAIIDLIEVPESYSVRKESKCKEYCYRIINAPIGRVFLKDISLWKKGDLDTGKMTQAIKRFEGKHDFSAFRGKGCQQPDPLKTIHSASINVLDKGDYTKIDIVFVGSGFLKNMVRIMVGTLIDIGRGNLPENQVSIALKSGKREDAGITAPARGLTLEHIFLEHNLFKTRGLDAWDRDL